MSYASGPTKRTGASLALWLAVAALSSASLAAAQYPNTLPGQLSSRLVARRALECCSGASASLEGVLSQRSQTASLPYKSGPLTQHTRSLGALISDSGSRSRPDGNG